MPIPPELVQLLTDSVYDRAWKKARALAFPDDLVASPLARRPYDLRHAAVSLWLNGGVPATEVARRVGHSVAVLLTVYANCIDGQEEVVNERIAAALAHGRVTGQERASSADGGSPDHESAGQA